ncbi:MAG: hypothetical protein JWR47_3016 [Phenylobacterium sp.]|jgi:hypothetical protein|nr:hypothetical protein [Phenylobacterium sp.]MDB5436759.1 hypothetical protein [Phenylobacterium sp.]
MILAALAAAVAAGGSPPAIERTPNLYRPVAGCADVERRVSADQQETLKKLGRLPNGIAQYAVARSFQGCPVPAPVGYHPPALPGAADAPAMREDAPSNRR